MKVMVVLTLLLLVACAGDDPQPAQSQPPVVLAPDDSLPDETVVLAKGRFVDGATGFAIAFDDGIGNEGLQFKNNFLVSGCTAIKVYLSQDLSITNSISVGTLKTFSGVQSYSLTGKPDFSLFKNIILWCEVDSSAHGVAELK